ncbi:MAG: hypothetical protein R3C19_22810 [Planctomycetaceae bacterium]
MMTDWVIREHFSILADQLDSLPFNSLRAARAKANLKALALNVSAAHQLFGRLLTDAESAGETAAAALLAMEIGDAEFVANATAALPDDAEQWEGIRRGLRLAAIGPLVEVLQQRLSGSRSRCRTALLDILSFHRLPIAVEHSWLTRHADDELFLTTITALSRSGDVHDRNIVAQAAQASAGGDAIEVLRAAARAGVAPLKVCRMRSVGDPPCLNSVRFLGVIGDESDHGLLRQLASREATASAATDAIGILGAAELLPDIIDAVSNPVTSQAAARALERISGTSVPRGDPPEPPEHLTEDERDFWHQPGEPLPDAVRLWWNRAQWSFDPGQRYQAGICVSDHPPDSVFDKLPDEIRRDVYLRQRARDFDNTPDRELETWPELHRTPKWATLPAAL